MSTCTVQDAAGWNERVEAVFYADRALPVQRQAFPVSSIMQRASSTAGSSVNDGTAETALFLAANADKLPGGKPAWPQYGQTPHQDCCAMLSNFGSLLDGPAKVLSAAKHPDGTLEVLVRTRRLVPSHSAAAVNAAIAARQLQPAVALHVALPGMEQLQSAACMRIRLDSLRLREDAPSRAAAQGLSIEQLHFASQLPQAQLLPPQPHQRCGNCLECAAISFMLSLPQTVESGT